MLSAVSDKVNFLSFKDVDVRLLQFVVRGLSFCNLLHIGNWFHDSETQDNASATMFSASET